MIVYITVIKSQDKPLNVLIKQSFVIFILPMTEDIICLKTIFIDI